MTIEDFLANPPDKLVVVPNPILRQVMTPVTDFRLMPQIAELMIELMRRHGGLGLAAPQIGLDAQIFVTNPSPWHNEHARVFINPSVRPDGSIFTITESCLSVPGFTKDIARHRNCMIVAQDQWANRFELRADGLLARICQHEYDHLRGVLIDDDRAGVAFTIVTHTNGERTERAATGHEAARLKQLVGDVDFDQIRRDVMREFPPLDGTAEPNGN